MMKYVSIVFLFVFFLLGSQNVVAQNLSEINGAASEQTAALKKQIKFSTDQEHKVYDAYVLYKKRLHQLEKSNVSSTLEEEKKKLYAHLCSTLKDILNDDQYLVFLDYEKRNLN